MDILKAIGYAANPKGEYMYIPASVYQEKHDRRTAVEEFRRFCEDIKKARDGNLPGFKEFLEVNRYHQQMTLHGHCLVFNRPLPFLSCFLSMISILSCFHEIRSAKVHASPILL